MANRSYTEEEITALIELAQEVGLTRAIRDLGYPAYGTALRWMRVRGIPMDLVDPLKQKAAETREFYKEQEKLAVAQQGLERVFEVLSTHEVSQDALTPDDIKKLADATKRLIEAMALVEGKPTAITQENAPDDVFTNLLKDFTKNEDVSQRGLELEDGR